MSFPEGNDSEDLSMFRMKQVLRKGVLKEQGFDIKYVELRYRVSTLCFPEVHASMLRPLLM